MRYINDFAFNFSGFCHRYSKYPINSSSRKKTDFAQKRHSFNKLQEWLVFVKINNQETLVYEVVDKKICIMVIAVGKRDKNMVYKKAQQRIR